MKPVQQLLALVLYDLWKQQRKNTQLRKFEREVEKLRITIKDPDALNDKIDRMKNDEIKKLIFDKYLLQMENDRQKNNTIGSYFKTVL